MKLQEKIDRYYSQFEDKERGDETIVILKDDYDFESDNVDEELRDSLMKAHGGRLPIDWVFEKYRDILGKLSDNEYQTLEEIDEDRAELIDNMIDVYTKSLTEWLNDTVYNVYYLTEVLEEFEIKDGCQLLQYAQGRAIGEIFSEVINLLEK